MRTRLFIAAVSVLAVLFIGAGGMYVYDSGRDDLVSEGITVSGVPIGGLRADAAKAKLRSELLPRLDHGVVARRDKLRFTLTARQAHVGVNLDATVDEAVARSRDASIVTRTLRSLRGDPIDAELTPQVSFSRQVVDGFVKRIGRKLNRKPKDADLVFTAEAPEPQLGKDGLSVETGQLRRQVTALLAGTAAARTLQIPAHVTKPKVTRDKLAEKYPTLLIVNRGGFQLKLFKHLKLVKSFPIAVGQVGLETPAGLYHIQNKVVDPAWHVPNSAWAGDKAGTVVPGGIPANPLKARWLGIFDGAGIHGTDAISSLGSAASHGCIRMAIPDVIELYDEVDVQTPVYIA